MCVGYYVHFVLKMQFLFVTFRFEKHAHFDLRFLEYELHSSGYIM